MKHVVDSWLKEMGVTANSMAVPIFLSVKIHMKSKVVRSSIPVSYFFHFHQFNQIDLTCLSAMQSFQTRAVSYFLMVGGHDSNMRPSDSKEVTG